MDIPVIDNTHDCDVVTSPAESCGTGCARLCLPRTPMGTGTLFTIGFSNPSTWDFTNATATFKVCLLSGQTGSIQTFGQEGATRYAGRFDTISLVSISRCSVGFSSFAYTFAAVPGAFNYAATASIGIKLQADTSDGTAPIVLYVDSIDISFSADGGMPPSDAGAGSDGGVTVPWPYDFTTSFSPFAINPYQPVPYSRVDWVP
jgi:hypothetical protein